MRTTGVLVAAMVVAAIGLRAGAQTPAASPPDIQVVLLGTQAGPTYDVQRLGISTLVIAGPERLLFDAGRGTTTGMARAGINSAGVTRIFLTHLHSDHVVSLPELLISPWAFDGRSVPLRVWGPAGTRAMMQHFQEALTFDIHVRRDLDEKFAADGVRVESSDITEGVVRVPSLFWITTADPPSIIATHEFVVPRSMPMTFDMVRTPPSRAN